MSSGFFRIKNGVSLDAQTAYGSSDPSDGVDGDIYYNSTLNVFRVYQSGAWETLLNSTNNTRTLNNQVGTTYTLALTDGAAAGGQPLLTLNNAAAVTVTVPLNSSVAFPVGSQVDVIQLGAGAVTFTPAGGVTINSNGGLTIGAQYVGVTLIQIAANSWILTGYLT